MTIILILLAFVAGYYVGKIIALKEATQYLKDSTKTTTKRNQWKS